MRYNDIIFLFFYAVWHGFCRYISEYNIFTTMSERIEKLKAVHSAEKSLYQAKVDYITATLNEMINEQPIEELGLECMRFILDTYDKATELNGDE